MTDEERADEQSCDHPRARWFPYCSRGFDLYVCPDCGSQRTGPHGAWVESREPVIVWGIDVGRSPGVRAIGKVEWVFVDDPVKGDRGGAGRARNEESDV